MVGLTILYLGFAGVTGMTLMGTTQGYIPRHGLRGRRYGRRDPLLARYFTLTRRMVAPSIALAIMFGLLAAQLRVFAFAAIARHAHTRYSDHGGGPLGSVPVGVLPAVPCALTMALIALSVFATTFGVATLGGVFPNDPRDLFLLSADGPLCLADHCPRPHRSDPSR